MAALVITLWLFTALPGSISQDKAPHPDLHGTWALVPSQSNFGEKQSNTTDYTITIIQQQSEIKITASYLLKGARQVEQWSYYTDGRPQALPGVKDADITTRWRGRKLYSSYHISGPI